MGGARSEDRISAAPLSIKIDLLPVLEMQERILAKLERLEAVWAANGKRTAACDEWLTMEAMVESMKSSPSTVERRVYDGSIEKSYHMGPKSPRYRVKKTAVEGARI